MAAVAELSVSRLGACSCKTVLNGSSGSAVSHRQAATFSKLSAERNRLKAALRAQQQIDKLPGVGGSFQPLRSQAARRSPGLCRAASAGGGFSPDHDKVQQFEDLVEEAAIRSASGTGALTYPCALTFAQSCEFIQEKALHFCKFTIFNCVDMTSECTLRESELSYAADFAKIGQVVISLKWSHLYKYFRPSVYIGALLTPN